MALLTFLVSVLSTVSTARAIRYLGRVNPATKELTWSGTGISFTFTGTSANISLSSISGTNSAELVIDGGTPIPIPSVTNSSISTPADLKQGNHTVIFRKRSEPSYGTLTIGNVTTDGIFGPDVAPSERQIEIIGDSITAAYGIDGTPPCTNTAALEDVTKTYAVLAANALKADYSIIAWSGIGITRNYGSGAPDPSPVMPKRYTHYGANDPDGSYTFPSSWSPAAVVINLGTNDFSHNDGRPVLNATAFATAYVELVKEIQAHYPRAAFFLMTSPMLNDGGSGGEKQKSTQTQALRSVVARLNGTKAYLVDWPSQGSEVGCDYHPTPATNAAEAPVLADAIRKALGW